MSSPRRDARITVGRALSRVLLSQLVFLGGLTGGALLIVTVARRVTNQIVSDVVFGMLLVGLLLGVLAARQKILLPEEPIPLRQFLIGKVWGLVALTLVVALSVTAVPPGGPILGVWINVAVLLAFALALSWPAVAKYIAHLIRRQ